MGPTILSFVGRSSLSRKSNKVLAYGIKKISFVGRSSLSRRSNKVLAHGIETHVLCREVVPISEGPISEVLLLYYYTSVRKVMMLAQLRYNP